MKIPSLEEFQNWYKEYSSRHPIIKKQGTWLHYLAFIVHGLAKFTALIPNLRKKIKPQNIKLDPMLRAQLKAKFDLYCNLIKTHQDSNGFIMSDQCDSLLYSSLISAAGVAVNIKSARDEEDFWHRRSTLPDCYPKESASTISRDMFTGLIWHLYSNKDLDSTEKLYNLAKQHNFVMGQGDPARIVLMPGLEATAAEIIYNLGGENHWFARHQSQTWPTSLTGYQIHLLMLHSLLRAKVQGYVPSNLVGVYQHYLDQNPNNPLFRFAYKLYTDGDMDGTTRLLLTEQFWPSDRLPKVKDRNSEWLVADDSSDWTPGIANVEREFTGGDFIFVAWLVLNS